MMHLSLPAFRADFAEDTLPWHADAVEVVTTSGSLKSFPDGSEHHVPQYNRYVAEPGLL